MHISSPIQPLYGLHMTNLTDSMRATEQHITTVQQRIIELLMQRAKVHDASKLEEPEASGYARLGSELGTIAYGTPEYRAALDRAQDVIQHHYAHNSHHPEYHENGVNDMSLLDIMEMFCDWKAASERMKQGSGSIIQSIEYNAGRFGLSKQLTAILLNTARELGWN